MNRTEAAAEAIYDHWFVTQLNMTESEGLADTALAAADAVMFSDAAIERAAIAIAVSVNKIPNIWPKLSPYAQGAYINHVRAVLAALKEGTE